MVGVASASASDRNRGQRERAVERPALDDVLVAGHRVAREAHDHLDDLARTARPVVEGGGRVVVRAAGVPPAGARGAGRARGAVDHGERAGHGDRRLEGAHRQVEPLQQAPRDGGGVGGLDRGAADGVAEHHGRVVDRDSDHPVGAVGGDLDGHVGPGGAGAHVVEGEAELARLGGGQGGGEPLDQLARAAGGGDRGVHVQRAVGVDPGVDQVGLHLGHRVRGDRRGHERQGEREGGREASEEGACGGHDREPTAPG